MSHEPIPVERVRPALAAWGLDGGDIHIERIPPGATADVFLVQRGDVRWVAKYGYQEPQHFEAGLATSEVIDVGDWAVATPVRTTDGDDARIRMVEWPDGHDHPLALLRWVDGRVLENDDPIEIKAKVCGRVHAQLLDLDPASVGVEVVPLDRRSEPFEPWNLGPYQWVNDVLAELQEATLAWQPKLRQCVAVWDGPDIRVRNDDTNAIGLIDFGHTSWHPLVHVVANRSLAGPDQGISRLPRFLDALQAELPLTSAELDALDTFLRHNAAIYARWAANRVYEHGDGGSLVEWLESLTRFLRR